MSVEALWTVQFASNVGGTGRGVVVFETGRVLGGDPDYIYLGKYDLSPDGKQFSCELDVTNYSGRLNSIFGPTPQFKLRIDAPVPTNDAIGSIMQASGYLVGNPTLKIAIILTKRALLP